MLCSSSHLGNHQSAAAVSMAPMQVCNCRTLWYSPPLSFATKKGSAPARLHVLAGARAMLQYLLYGICTMNQSDREGLRYPDKLALACTARGCAGTLLADERRQASSGEATVRPQVTGPMQWLHADRPTGRRPDLLLLSRLGSCAGQFTRETIAACHSSCRRTTRSAMQHYCMWHPPVMIRSSPILCLTVSFSA